MCEELSLRLKWYANVVHCQCDHTKVYEITLDDLLIGDFLFWHGHTILNKAIQTCTKSKYNHISIYVGDGLIVHAVGRGVVLESIENAWVDSDKFVHVYRYHDWMIKSPQATLQQRKQVADKARYFASRNERYATEVLISLGILTQLRDKQVFIGRKLADDSFNAVATAFADGKEPMICSEAGYRSFDESGFPIRILPEGLHSEYFNTKNPLVQAFKAQKYNQFHINPNFVTPHDLVMSPDIDFVAGLRRPSEN